MNTNPPLVSVVMSVFNDEYFLQDVLICIVNQTYKNLEIIIVDDCSTDNTSKILKEFLNKDKRVKVLKNKKNLGLTKSLNKAILNSSGKYIARHDADDYSFDSRIEKQVNFLEKHNDYAMCGTQRVIHNKIIQKTYKDFLPIDYISIRKTALYKNPFFHSSVVIKKKILLKVGLYNERFKYVQDLELWSRIIFRYKCKNLDEILCKKLIDHGRISFNKRIQLKRRYFSLLSRISVFKHGNYNYFELLKMFLVQIGILKTYE